MKSFLALRTLICHPTTDLLKARSQILQMKGLSPRCFLLCLVSSSDLENLQSQSVQGQRNGFSPVWVLV